MKTFTFLVISMLLIASEAISQDDFTVIKVNGTIILRSKGISLSTGTIFSPEEALLFQTKDATAAVINPVKGRMLLTSSGNSPVFAKSNALPSMYNISSRGLAGTLLNSNDFKTRFAGNYVIIEKISFITGRKNFPMDQNRYFFLRYKFKGEDINKKMKFSGDTLFIEKSSLYTVDSNPIEGPDTPAVRLFYHDGKKSSLISEFNLIFPDVNLLRNEVKIIIDGLDKKPASEIRNDVLAYIVEMYGKTDRENLSGWLRKEFGIK